MIKGFAGIVCAVPELKLADCRYNSLKIIEILSEVNKKGTDFLLFPELSITGCSLGDLFFSPELLAESKIALDRILDASNEIDTIIFTGLPLMMEEELYNVNAVLYKGQILGVVPKIITDPIESRWFSSTDKTDLKSIELLGCEVPVGSDLVFRANTDEDEKLVFSMYSPRKTYSKSHLIFNNRAAMYESGSGKITREHMASFSLENNVVYACVQPGIYESTGEGIYSGYSAVFEQGRLLVEDKGFKTISNLIYTDSDIDKIKGMSLRRKIHPDAITYIDFKYKGKREIEREPCYILNMPHPYAGSDMKEIFDIQSYSLAVRMKKINSSKAVIGVSGGLDSTLALLVIKRAFEILNKDPKDIIAVTMPGFGTTGKTRNNAVDLIRYVKAQFREIDITKSCLLHFEDIGHDKNVHDTTYENVQARERTQILMDIANKEGGLVIGTGDLSELALGWCTYNGDHMSMYSVNSGVYKTLIKYILKWYKDTSGDIMAARLIEDIIDTPVSPELLPGDDKGDIKQKTEDIIGPYELHDFFIHHRLNYNLGKDKIIYLAELAFKDKYDIAVIDKWYEVFDRRFRTQQFKRSCMPEGPKVLDVSLSPRSGFFMPADL